VNAQYNQDNINNNNNNNSINNNYKKINFTNAFNLTNNTKDSVYPRVSAFGNNVYVIWQESVPPGLSSKLKDNSNNISSSSNSSLKNEPNYDIFIRKSNDGGKTFGKEINLSNNSGFSEHPHLAVYGNNVYAIWIDNDISANNN